MSCNDFLAIRPRKHLGLQDSSLLCTGPSTWTWHPTTSSSITSLPHSYSSKADLLDPLDEIALDSDLDQRVALSTTFLSHCVSPSQSTNQLLADANLASSASELDLLPQPSGLRSSLYLLHEPGQMIAQHTQRLRARTAAVIQSLPATSEEVVDADEHEPRKATEAPSVCQVPKLRRVPRVRDLRRAFRDGDHAPIRFASASSLGISKASCELGVLTNPTSPSSHLSLRSSLRTLVDLSIARLQSSGDLKTLCGSTFSSVSVASQNTTTDVRATLSASRLSHTRLRSDSSLSILPSKRLVQSPLTPKSQRRHTSLQLDTPSSQPPGITVWSCAKISQSAIKRAARRGHPPRRVFSHPTALCLPEG